MRIHFLFRSALAALATLLAVHAAESRPVQAGETQLLIKPTSRMSEVAVHALLSAHGARAVGSVAAIGVRIVRVPAKAAEHVLAAFQAHGDVDYAELDFTARALGTANDPYFQSGQEWHIGKIQAPSAWDFSTGSTSVIVAVVDTGVNARHPDIAGKVLPGYDFVNGDSDPSDDNGHGTAVAGVAAAATNNSVGISGVAWANPVLPVKVLDASGSGTYSGIANGITYAAAHGARIINLSLGGTSSSKALQDAVNYAWNKNAVIVAAAGNDGNTVAVYPAACANVVAVSATNSSDLRPSWSNYGSYVDLSAPGENIVTLYGADAYAAWNGTSFASPVVAGVTALMASANVQLSNLQIVDLLLKNADDLGPAGYDVYSGYGRVNAYRAAFAAKGYVTADTTAPAVAFSSPASGATVAGTVNISASATDNVGVTRTELYIDGAVVALSSGASAGFSWNTLGYAGGTHTLQARAYDAAGNRGTTSITVTVKNSTTSDTTAPAVAITSPADGSKITTTIVKINVSSSDNVGVTKLELYIDGKLFGTSPTATAVFTWNTAKVAAGPHKLQAYGYDAARNIGVSSLITVSK